MFISTGAQSNQQFEPGRTTSDSKLSSPPDELCKLKHSVARLGTGSLSDNPADNTIGSALDILLLVNRIVLQKLQSLIQMMKWLIWNPIKIRWFAWISQSTDWNWVTKCFDNQTFPFCVEWWKSIAQHLSKSQRGNRTARIEGIKWCNCSTSWLAG